MNVLKKIIAMSSIVALCTGAAKGQETKITESERSTLYGLLDNSTINKNMFAGMNFGNFPMNQTYAEFGNKNMFLSTWTNYDLKAKKSVEVDLNVGYKGTIKLGDKTSLTLQPGFTYYIFPNQDILEDYKELNFKASIEGLPLDVSVRAGKLFGEGINKKDAWDGILFDVVASKTTELTHKLSISEGLEVIYNGNYTTGKRGVSHGVASATLTYSPIDNLFLNATACYQQRIDEKFATPATETFFSGTINSEPYFKAGFTYMFK